MSEASEEYAVEAGGNELYVSTDPAAVAEMAQWIPDGRIVRRIVIRRAWHPVACTHDIECLLHLDEGVH